MRLSEAIRLGAMLGPQTTGKLIEPGTMATCALGAAGLAVGVNVRDDKDCYEEIEDKLPDMLAVVHYPINDKCCSSTDIQTLRHIIPHLNDEHHWTREQIADWVDQVLGARERQETQETQETPRESKMGEQEGSVDVPHIQEV